jgi:hypothetical protein
MPGPLLYALFAGLLIAVTVFGVALAMRSGARPRYWVPVAVGLWLAAVVFMTVRPGSGLGVRLNLIPIVVDGPGSGFDAVLNTLVFVPLGILLAVLGWRIVGVLGAALAVSLAIEVTQYLTNWGRTADVNDLITNVLGAGIGWMLAWAIRRARLSPA